MDERSLCERIDNTFGPYAGHCRGGFDFTLFFEETILSILPLVLFCFFVPFRTWYLIRKEFKVKRSLLLPFKLVRVKEISYIMMKQKMKRIPRHIPLLFSLIYLSFLVCLLAKPFHCPRATCTENDAESGQVLWVAFGIIQIVLLVLWADKKLTRTKASIPNAAINVVGTMSLGLISYVEHQRTIRPSLMINGYLVLSIGFDAAATRTLWLQGYNNAIAAVTSISMALRCVLLVAESIRKESILRAEWKGESPEATSGLIGKVFFGWLNRLFMAGYSRSLSLEDLFPLDKHLTSDYLYHMLSKAWIALDNQAPKSLFLLVVSRIKWHVLSAFPPRLGLIAFTFCQPFLITRAIELSQESVTPASSNDGYGLIGAYLIVYVGIAITSGQYQHLTYRAITMARGGLISMMFAKTSSLESNAVDSAQALTLMSADIERITNGWQTMHEIWASIIEIAIAIYLLERQLGAACAIPIAVAIREFEQLFYQFKLVANFCQYRFWARFS